MDYKEKLEYWTKYSFDKMRKDGAIMPTTIPKILALEEFKNSGVTEEQLRQSIKERFIGEREKIVDSIKE
jgi:hypothetical protein